MRLYFIILLVANNVLWGQTVPANTTFDSLRSSIQEWVKEASAPSVSIAVSHRGKPIWQEAFGWQNAAKAIKATSTTMYPIASVTKTFTATAVMGLVEEGAINLDAPVAEYFNRSVIKAHFVSPRRVTVRDLLRHTSGLEMYYRNVYHDEVLRSGVPPIASEQFNTLVFSPGERFAYANVGYAILGELIEVVSGMPYEAYLQQFLFDPLNLEHTAVRISSKKLTQYAQLRGAKGEVLPLVYTDTKGAGDIYSTAEDLVKYGEFHLGLTDEGVLKKATVELMRTVVDTTINRPDPCSPYGLGWFFEEESPGPQAFWHEGGFDGAGAILKLIPEEELVVAVIGNTTFNKARSTEIADAIINLLVEDYVPYNCPEPGLAPGVDTTNFKGEWSGNIYANQDTIPLNLRFTEDGEIIAGFSDSQTRFFFIDDQAFPKEAFVHYPNSNKTHLTGWLLEGIITTEDWQDNHHIVQLDLYYSDNENVITGAAKAFETNQDREGMATAFYVRLTKK